MNNMVKNKAVTVISGWLASVCRSRGERRGYKKKRKKVGEIQERQGREATPVSGLFPDGHDRQTEI